MLRRLVTSKNQDDKLKAATVTYLVKESSNWRMVQRERAFRENVEKALLHDAKLQLKELQRRPPKASSQIELSQELGPEYDQVKALLKPTGVFFR